MHYMYSIYVYIYIYIYICTHNIYIYIYIYASLDYAMVHGLMGPTKPMLSESSNLAPFSAHACIRTRWRRASEGSRSACCTFEYATRNQVFYLALHERIQSLPFYATSAVKLISGNLHFPPEGRQTCLARQQPIPVTDTS